MAHKTFHESTFGCSKEVGHQRYCMASRGHSLGPGSDEKRAYWIKIGQVGWTQSETNKPFSKARYARLVKQFLSIKMSKFLNFIKFLKHYILAPKLIGCDYKFESFKTIINDLFPKSYASWWFLNVSQIEFKKAYSGHQLQFLENSSQMVVPAFKGIPDGYR